MLSDLSLSLIILEDTIEHVIVFLNPNWVYSLLVKVIGFQLLTL